MCKNSYPVLLLLLFLVTATSFSQTPGLIFDPSTSVFGRSVLDPNGDGYSSPTTAGFITKDQGAGFSEILYIPFIFPGLEPNSDLSAGPNCSFTDFVDSGVEDPAMVYYDALGRWLFRFRMGRVAPNSKSYSVLIDTDLKFGNSGPNADPDYITGNPGFEIEIVLATNFGVFVYDVDGKGTGSVGAPVISYNVPDYHVNYQKSVALSADCGDADYFLDFFVLFSDLTSQFGITPATPLRMAIVDNMAAQKSTINNSSSASDIAGVDCNGFTDACFADIIDNYTPTCATCGNTPGLDRSDCPSITGPIANLADLVSGITSHGIGTTINVYKNGSLIGTTVAGAGGAWTLSGISPVLASNDTISASATASGMGESINNCDETIVDQVCSNPPTVSCLSTKGILGTGPTGAPAGTTIRIYNANGLVATVVTDASNGFVYNCNSGTNCTSGPPTCLPDGSYWTTAQETGKCESIISNIMCNASGGSTVSAVPVISTDPIADTTTVISGTCTSGAWVILYNNGTVITNTTASGTNWTVTVSGLVSGDQITAKANDPGKCLSAATAAKTVIQYGTAPIILGTYCVTGSLAPPDSIYGISSDPAGTIVVLFKNGVRFSPNVTTTVRSDGTWGISTGSWSYVPANTITAYDSIPGGPLSAVSNIKSVGAKTTNAVAITTDPIVEQAVSVSGTGTDGDVIRLYVDDVQIGGTDIVTAGTWTIGGLGIYDLYPGGIVYAKATSGTNCESDSSVNKTVQCILPLNTIQLDPADTTVCSGSVAANVRVNSSENLIIYQLYNGISPTGSSVLGTGGTILLTSAPLTSSTTLTVKALKFTGVTCDNFLLDGVDVTVNANPTASVLSGTASICNGESTNLSAAITGGTSPYAITIDNGVGTITNYTSGSDISISPASTTTYSITSVVDNNGCISSGISGAPTITVTGQANDTTLTVTACDSYTLGSQTYNSSGTYVQTQTNIGGCDSIITLNLTINNSTTGTDVISACDSYIWIDGNTYTASNNTATHTLANAAGCDSVVTLNLTINNSTTGTDVISACDSYTWIDGNTYSASNSTATHTLTNAAGCDSVVTLNLTIKNSTTGTDVISACDSYTWIDGNTYTSSNNTATHILTNAAGCDSVVTLNLTIKNSTTGTDIISACDSYTWIDGNTYMASNNTATHTLTNAAGCDSVVTLNLTIKSSTTGTDIISACASYTWIDGNTYMASNNTATHTLTNAAGCDSVVTLNLTIKSSTTGTDVISACDSYTWIDGNTYTASNNTATHTLTNAAGCDSVVTLNLTIKNSTVGTDVISACDSYTWIDGNTYSASNNTATHTLTNAAGCDSVVTLNLTIKNSTTGTDVISACDSYTWIDGNTYTSSNSTATHTLTNAAGCDSVVTLNLIIKNSTTGMDVISACDSYTWIDGNTYSASNNTATHTLTNAAGCDSVVTLSLTIKNSTTGTDVVSACDSYTWIDGNTYTASNNTATHTLTNAAGCDSVVTLNLTIKNSTTGTDVISACDSYTWIDGNTYTSSNNTATHILTNAAGCDSVVTLNLTIKNSTTGTDVISACDSYTWIDGNTYTSSGNTATHTLTNAAGCDSVVTLNLTITNGTTGTDVISACDSYTWIDGNTYTSSNSTATHTLTNAAGCDSLVTLNLTIKNSTTGTDVISACDSYTWIDGNTYTSSNSTATHTLTNAAGCDSVVTLNLTIKNSTTGTDVISACDSYTWIDGNTYSASNSTATHTLTNAAGCDSVVTLNLTIKNSTTGTDVISACDSYTWIDGNTYTSSGNTATHTLTNAAGCDSIVTLNLAIKSSTTGTDIISACDSYTWIDGNTYTSSNSTATHTLTNAAGCDSLVTLNLTIKNSTTGTDIISACDSYTWIDGNTYTSSNNTATHTLANAAGCDSVVTLNLTIKNSTTGTDVISACDSYTWIDGNTYTSSNSTATHTLTNAAGCDSVVTLNLTIKNSTTGMDVISACDSYTWIDGNTYTASNNTATHTLINAAGCDSVVTLNLTIKQSTSSTLTETACDSYTMNSTTYNLSGSYIQTLTNADGCDSTITLNLTIIQSEAVNAGTNQNLTCSATSATLSASAPSTGSGTWTVTAGTGIFTNSSDPNSTVNGLSAGTNTFRWTISNPPCADAFEEVNINVVCNNLPPEAQNDTVNVPEDGFVSIDVQSNDSDPNNDPLTTSIVISASNGTAVLNGNNIDYMPDADYNGNDTIIYAVCDTATPALCDTAYVFIIVTPVNDPPVAQNDSISIDEDSNPVAIDVQANDSDIDGDELTTFIVSGPSNGTAGLNGNNIDYTPNPDFNGNDTIIYAVCDNGTPPLCDTAFVYITVNPVNDPPVANDDSVSVSASIPVTIAVLSNDFDVDGDSLLVTIISGPDKGTASTNSDGTITYTSFIFFLEGTDTIFYQLCDNGNPDLCDTAWVLIILPYTNYAPFADNDTVEIYEDSTATVDILSNDYDPNGGLIIPSILSGPFNGSASLNGSGELVYIPDPDFNGLDSVIYMICDTASPSLCDTALVVITVLPVNDAPVANNDVSSTNPEVPVTVSVLINDFDVDGDSLFVSVFAQPANGNAVVNANGTITYTPDPGFTIGIDTIVYVLCDNGTPSLCDTAIVAIYVPFTNLPPVADDDYITIPEDSSAIVDVLTNDYDPTGDSLIVTIASGPSNGTAAVNSNGEIEYIPNTDFSGKDTIVYSVCDTVNPPLYDTALVIITVTPVNDPPQMPDTSISTPENTPVAICLTIDDPDAGDTFNTTICGVNNGTASVNVSGNQFCAVYDPAIGFNGYDTLCVIVCDNGNPSMCDTSFIIIDVIPVNDPPVANNDYTSTDPGVPVTVNVLQNDSDPDGDSLSVSIAADPDNGTATVNSDGSITYTPNSGFTSGIDTIVYAACDNGTPPLCDTAMVIIYVPLSNLPPVAINDTVAVPEDSTVAIPVLINDFDPNADSLAVSIISGPSNGTASVNSNGEITYTPGLNYSGTDSIIYQICDTAAPPLCATATVFITVAPVNDPPVANNDVSSTDPGVPVIISILVNDYDTDGDSLFISTLSGPANGTASINADGTITYTPDIGFISGIDTIIYTVCDNGIPPLCDTALVQIFVPLTNLQPVANDDYATLPEDSVTDIDVLSNDYDPANDSLIVSIVSGPGNGMASVNSNGEITYTPNPDYFGNDTIIYSACDTGSPAACDTAVVYIIVTPVADSPVVEDTSITTTEDSTITVCLPVADADAGQIFSASSCGNPVNGSAAINVVGNSVCVTYIPNPDYNGLDSLCVLVCDNGGLCDTAIVNIIVTPVNDPPVVEDTTVTTTEDSVITVCLPVSDEDAGQIFSASSCGNPVNGSAAINVVGNSVCITYTPNPNYNGLDSLCVLVCDDGGLCDTAIVNIIVTPVNDPPVVEDTTVTTTEDSAITVCLPVSDADAGQIFSASSCGNPVNGSAAINVVGNSVCITYIPNSNYNGPDSLCVLVCDDGGLCDTAIVNIIVTPVNDPPVCSDTTGTTPEDTPVTVCTNISDPDPGSVFSAALCGVNNGTAAVSVTGNLLCMTYTPNAGFSGLDTVCVIVCDNGTPSLCDTVQIPITVVPDQPVNNPPVVAETEGTTPQDSTIILCTTISDPDIGSVFTETLCGVNNGSATVNVNGDQLCVTYTPNAGYSGMDTVCVIVCDNGSPSLCDTVQIPITVTPGDFMIPEGFSPNGDGINDFFEVKGILNYPDNHIMIFNRWGNLVYETQPYRNQWNGTYEGNLSIGNELPAGTYFYVLDLSNGSDPMKGYVYLSR